MPLSFMLDVTIYGVRGAKFAILTNNFALKYGAIFDHRSLQNLDLAYLARLLRSCIGMGFFIPIQRSKGRAYFQINDFLLIMTVKIKPGLLHNCYMTVT
jgi:hypothetical protein